MDFTIIQRNTLYNLIQVCLCHILVAIYMIDFLLQELRMSQFRCQVTVICQKQHTCSITVQTSYRINTLLAGTFHKIHHRLTFLRIVRSRYTILRFVKQHIHLTLNTYRLVVELHFIRTFHLRTQFRYNFTIYRYNSCSDKLIRFTTRADTCIRKELVQTNRFIRISQQFFILDLLLHAIFCIRVVVGSTRTVTSLWTTISALLSAIIIKTRTIRALFSTLLCIVKARTI